MTATSVEAGLAIRRASIRALSTEVKRFRPIHLLLELDNPSAPAAIRLITALDLRLPLERLAQAESLLVETVADDSGDKMRLHPEIVSILGRSSRLAHRSSVPCVTTAHLLTSTVSFLLTHRHASHKELEGLDEHVTQLPTFAGIRPATKLSDALLHLMRWREL